MHHEPRELSLQRTDRAITVHYGAVTLLRYVFRPHDAPVESPRPYFHPLRTLDGDEVTIFRPHDHVWHKGLAFSLPNVGALNLWGGRTYVRGQGYTQLPNNGTMRHRAFDDGLSMQDDRVTLAERLDWLTQQGETWFTEHRDLLIALAPAQRAWVLRFGTRFVNVSGDTVVLGSPATQGRDDAGYGGLFWRGPRSFTGGDVYTPDGHGGDDLMGVRAPWLAFTGTHDGHGRRSTVVMVDAPDNPTHPTRWFVRSTPWAGVCPAPFFDTELPVAPGEAVSLRYAVVVADGDASVTDHDGARARAWAALGAAHLAAT